MRRYIVLFFVFLQSVGVIFSQQKISTSTISNSLLKQFPLSDEIKETSGLIFWNNLLWTHNDDKDNQIYGIDPVSGIIKQRIPFNDLSVADWEELQHDEQYFYIGDLGNNGKGNRTNLQIVKKSKTSDKTETIQFSYPEQTDFSAKKANTTNFDCEAFIVSDSMIYLFTKEWNSNYSTLYKIPNRAGNHKAKRISTLKTQGLITGATFDEKRQLLLLTGYTKTLSPFLYLIFDFKNDDFFNGAIRKLKISKNFFQMETVAFINDSTIAITNEQFYHSFVKSQQQLTVIDLRSFLK